MSVETVLAHAEALWEMLAGVPVAFSPGQVEVVVSPGSLMCPAGWSGAVALGNAVIVTAPDAAAARMIRDAGARIGVTDIVVAERLGTVLPVAEVRGPAMLAYTSDELFQPVSRGANTIGRVLAGDSALTDLLELCGRADRDESGLEEITSPAFTLHSAGGLVSAAGYRIWPNHTAHISVLTAPDCRGRGLARMTAGAAVKHALAHGLTPQWRARTPASRRVAAALGFCELGVQLSFRLETDPGDDHDLA
ncbi:GNAT family N-acetyltransferase [Nocardia asteroides]